MISVYPQPVKKYSVEATFGFLSEVEKTTDISLIRLVLFKQDIRLDTIEDILRVFVKSSVNDDALQAYIIKNMVYLTNKIFDLLEIGFDNPNPKANLLKEFTHLKSTVV